MWVLEYSKSQNAYHVSTSDQRLMNEMTCLERKAIWPDYESDWKVVKTFSTCKEALNFKTESS